MTSPAELYAAAHARLIAEAPLLDKIIREHPANEYEFRLCWNAGPGNDLWIESDKHPALCPTVTLNAEGYNGRASLFTDKLVVVMGYKVRDRVFKRREDGTFNWDGILKLLSEIVARNAFVQNANDQKAKVAENIEHDEAEVRKAFGGYARVEADFDGRAYLAVIPHLKIKMTDANRDRVMAALREIRELADECEAEA